MFRNCWHIFRNLWRSWGLGGGGEGVFLGIFGGIVCFTSPNPGPLSDKNLWFSGTLFQTCTAFKIHIHFSALFWIHTYFQTFRQMVQIYTHCHTKTPQKPYPLVPHILTWGITPSPPPPPHLSQKKLCTPGMFLHGSERTWSAMITTNAYVTHCPGITGRGRGIGWQYQTLRFVYDWFFVFKSNKRHVDLNRLRQNDEA